MGKQLTHHVSTPAPATISQIERLEEETGKLEQLRLATSHVFHAGTYARTIHLPPGAVLVGARIKIPTLLIFAGDALVYGDEGAVHWKGYLVVSGEEGRKMAMFANDHTYLTMVFSTDAASVEEAEDEFTDEAESLMTRKGLA
jgi:hypothetical protein